MCANNYKKDSNSIRVLFLFVKIITVVGMNLLSLVIAQAIKKSLFYKYDNYLSMTLFVIIYLIVEYCVKLYLKFE